MMSTDSPTSDSPTSDSHSPNAFADVFTDVFADIAQYTQDPAPYLAKCAAEVPEWLDELDLKAAPPHVRMGTHALDLDNWFVIDELRESELALRNRLLTERRHDVFGVLPSAEAACAETLELVTEWLREHGHALAETTDSHPLAAAGQLVQDDLCIMMHRDGDWHLDAAILCFPSLWRLHEKLGTSTAAVHAPVNHYAEELSPKVDRFFDRLQVDKPVWRRNLSIKPKCSLYLPAAKAEVSQEAITVDEQGAPFWLRTERQTLRRLPKSDAILFTIRTQIAPISVLQSRPDRAHDLVSMYESWDTAMNEFKMADSDLDRSLLPWLRRVAAQQKD